MDMKPMLDIVFIMLIFLVVTAVFLDETGIDLTQPPPNTDTHNPVPTILVSIDARDRAVVDGRPTGLSHVPSRVEALRATKPDAVVVLAPVAASSVDALITLKDRFDSASVPVTIRVAR